MSSPSYNTVRLDIMEQHVFAASPRDNYVCDNCGKPRALHAHDDFVEPLPPGANDSVRQSEFRRHKYFYSSGWSNRKEEHPRKPARG